MGGTVEVLPDVNGLDRTFHYSVADGTSVAVGTIVRVVLHGRRVRGWVVGADTPVPAGVELRPIVEVVSVGPPPEVVDLCRWGAWRYAGRMRMLLLAASPERIVRVLAPGTPSRPPHVAPASPVATAVAKALSAGDAVLRLPPADERLPVVEAALAHIGPDERALVLVESRDDVERLTTWLRRGGWRVATYPEQWAEAASGTSDVVIGTRNAAFAPLTPALTLVLDAHADAYRSPKVPTFDARVVVAERARRTGTPVVFVTPCPTVELLAGGRSLVSVQEALERSGWGTVAVLDSRSEDPAEGGYPSRLVSWIREAAAAAGPPVVCILNRVGRARLLTCAGCRDVQRCPRCGSAQVMLERAEQGSIGVLSCPRCRDEEAAICPSCGSARLRVARPGVSRAREQLEAVTGLPVGEVSGPRSPVPESRIIIGTQAALHRVRRASMVAWLDFDQELLAPRYRAGEEALALLARSVRMVGHLAGSDRPPAARVVVRTSMPDHEVVRAAQTGRPGIVADAEAARRQLLGLPPYSAMARLDGEGAAAAAAKLAAGDSPPVEVIDVGDSGAFVVRARSAAELADTLAGLVAGDAAGWGGLDARVEVDPVDL